MMNNDYNGKSYTFRWAPMTGFDGAKFAIFNDDGSTSYPDWEYEVIAAVKHVPGGNRTIRQSMGTGPATVTYSVWCDSRAEYDKLRAKQGVSGVLRVIANMQSIRGTQRKVQNVNYEDISNVILTQLSGAKFDPDGPVEARATFMAPINTLTGTTS